MMRHLKRACMLGLVAACCSGCGEDDASPVAGTAGSGSGGTGNGAGGTDSGDDEPGPRVELGPRDVALQLALNDAASEQALRGFPLLLLGVAALTEEVSAPIPLDPAEAALQVTNEAGKLQGWPLLLLSPLPADLALDASLLSVQAWWALSPDSTAELDPGSYRLQLVWGERASPPLDIEIVDAPEAPEPEERLRLARLRAQHALLEGDTESALSAAQSGLDEQPDDIELLLWQARARELDGDLDAALESVRLALEQYALEHPGGPPPLTLLETRRKLLDQVLEQEAR